MFNILCVIVKGFLHPFFCPLAQCFGRQAGVQAGAAFNVCIGCELLHILAGVANRAATGCGERNDCLACEIIGFHKCVDD